MQMKFAAMDNIPEHCDSHHQIDNSIGLFINNSSLHPVLHLDSKTSLHCMHGLGTLNARYAHFQIHLDDEVSDYGWCWQLCVVCTVYCALWPEEETQANECQQNTGAALTLKPCMLRCIYMQTSTLLHQLRFCGMWHTIIADAQCQHCLQVNEINANDLDTWNQCQVNEQHSSRQLLPRYFTSSHRSEIVSFTRWLFIYKRLSD